MLFMLTLFFINGSVWKVSLPIQSRWNMGSEMLRLARVILPAFSSGQKNLYSRILAGEVIGLVAYSSIWQFHCALSYIR